MIEPDSDGQKDKNKYHKESVFYFPLVDLIPVPAAVHS